jgi:MerR family transcriptional regulator/heat shock protein HspR
MTMAEQHRSHPGHDDEAPVFVISVAAELAGMHAQTLRQYDRLGLVTPRRTRGGGRRYSGRDVALLREVQRLSQEGVSLAGIQRILELENHVDALQAKVAELTAELGAAHAALLTRNRIFAAGARGEVVAVRPGQRPPRPVTSQALVVWRPGR